jgi:hypothetical protein
MTGCCVLAGIIDPAVAQPQVSAEAELRSHGGPHALRVGVGIGSAAGCSRAMLLIDPWYFVDKQLTTDALLRLQPHHDIELQLGVRNQIVALSTGLRFYESIVLAASVPLRLQLGRVALYAGAQATALLVSHGTDLPTQWYSLARGTDNLEAYGFAMFLQGRYLL